MVRSVQAKVQQVARRRRRGPAAKSNAVITPGAGTKGGPAELWSNHR